MTRHVLDGDHSRLPLRGRNTFICNRHDGGIEWLVRPMLAVLKPPVFSRQTLKVFEIVFKISVTVAQSRGDKPPSPFVGRGFDSTQPSDACRTKHWSNEG
ncbi:hypothetical protein NO932_08425 [Pelagibacterium sp. 26DY04]|uniref:hypothetical protein n=1 Tax=Pelagibacterium sp. 26DY04 TaxID=2967130 RepID=UPI002815EF10|nr:hypothetical protein [Pelagibacterium sp. 26DY04]WMT88622.1 hypothetical protein NO932_08425 [Pelagibacterium sp. 26DY04]